MLETAVVTVGLVVPQTGILAAAVGLEVILVTVVTVGLGLVQEIMVLAAAVAVVAATLLAAVAGAAVVAVSGGTAKVLTALVVEQVLTASVAVVAAEAKAAKGHTGTLLYAFSVQAAAAGLLRVRPAMEATVG